MANQKYAVNIYIYIYIYYISFQMNQEKKTFNLLEKVVFPLFEIR